MKRGVLLNFIYIGPNRAGSSWLYELLKWHPETCVTAAKDLYFFAPSKATNTCYFHLGLDWYARQFKPTGTEKIICEVCHDYLDSAQAARRIHHMLPEVRLMVCLREPAERSFSAYLYWLMIGYCKEPFEEAIRTYPFLLRESRYGELLEPYLDIFGRERIFVGVFDDLKQNPDLFAKSLFSYLGVEQRALPPPLHEKVLPAGRARWLPAAKAARLAAAGLRRMGFPAMLGRFKSSKVIRSVLYRPYSQDEKPRLSRQQRTRLREHFAEDVAKLDRLLGTSLAERWGYAQPPVRGTQRAGSIS